MAQTCDSCQTLLDDEAKFCTECGQKMGAADEAPVEWPPPKPERPRPRIFGAVLGALVVWTIIIIILTFFVYVVVSAPTPAGL